MPIQTPITAARTVDVPTSSSVGQIRSTIRSETGHPVAQREPEVAVSVFFRKVTNCWRSGWSSP